MNTIGLKAQNQSLDLDYETWEYLLQKHVSKNGLVDYKGFMEDKEQLYKFTAYLSNHTPNDNWSDNKKKAYLINIYNAYTIQMVVNSYPIKSIKDITGMLSSVFNKEFIDFNGKKVSLDYIEKKLLLPMGDPRVHFAVNCASYSCPKLDNKAYKAEDIDIHLDKAAQNFINSELNVITKDNAELSKIFNWYKGDFETKNQSVIDFINSYSKVKLNEKASIDYLDYNWNLNSK
jgi:hypothetical protein